MDRVQQNGALYGWSESNCRFERLWPTQGTPDAKFTPQPPLSEEDREYWRKRHMEFLAVDDDGGLLD